MKTKKLTKKCSCDGLRSLIGGLKGGLLALLFLFIAVNILVFLFTLEFTNPIPNLWDSHHGGGSRVIAFIFFSIGFIEGVK